MELALTNTHENNISKTIVNVANNALEFGLKAILPDFIEDDVIEIKNKFIQEGFIEGVQSVIDKLEDVGKSVKGIFTGEFDSLEQVKRVIQTNGILDGVSTVVDKILKKLLDKKAIKKPTYNMIKQGKKEILNSLENEIEETYKPTTYSMEKLEEYCQEWQQKYKEKDYSGMEKAAQKIRTKLKQTQIVEEMINKARNVEKIQKYIKENGNIDSLTDVEKELLEKIK